MKKILLLFVLFLGTIINLSALDTYFQIKLKNGAGQQWNNLIFGVSDSATAGMDENLNEKEIPDFPFPNGIFTAVALTYDSTEQKDVWSYRSVFGKPQDSTLFMVRYRFRLFYGGSNTVTMRWANLDKHINSAYLIDKWGGNWLNVDMKLQDSAVISETLVDHFDVVVVYDFADVGVVNYGNENINIYPNPFSQFCVVQTEKSINSIEICNIFGEILSYNFINDKFAKIDLQNLKPGIYFARIIDVNGDISVKKIIKN